MGGSKDPNRMPRARPRRRGHGRVLRSADRAGAPVGTALGAVLFARSLERDLSNCNPTASRASTPAPRYSIAYATLAWVSSSVRHPRRPRARWHAACRLIRAPLHGDSAMPRHLDEPLTPPSPLPPDEAPPADDP